MRLRKTKLLLIHLQIKRAYNLWNEVIDFILYVCSLEKLIYTYKLEL